MYKPLTPQSSGPQPEVEKDKTSSGVASYTQELRKKLKGPNGGRGIFDTG